MLLRSCLLIWLCLSKTTSLSCRSYLDHCYFCEFGSESQFDSVDGEPLAPTSFRFSPWSLPWYTSISSWYIGTAIRLPLSLLDLSHSLLAEVHSLRGLARCFLGPHGRQHRYRRCRVKIEFGFFHTECSTGMATAYQDLPVSQVSTTSEVLVDADRSA